MNPIGSQNAPSPKVVIPHFVFGGLVWLVVTLLITFNSEAFTQHFFNPILLSITHLLALGWITMVIFGALYQLIPVIVEVKLYSEKLAVFSFVLLGLGTLLLAFSFWNLAFGILMFTAGGLILVAVISFLINILTTIYKSTKKSIERTFIVSAVIWLLFTVLAGLTLAINFNHPFLKPAHLELLKLHAHAGIVGWFLQLIIGVSSRLIPMFMVAHNLNTKKLNVAFYLINFALIIGIFSLFFGIKWSVTISIILGLIGVFSYLSFLVEAYQKRIKKQLDIGMKQSAFSFLLLLIPCLLILMLLPNFSLFTAFTLPLIIAYGSILMVGFITSLIMGQTYKTLPFIVWLKVYRGKIGKLKLPLPKDLYNEKIAVAQLWLFALGVVVFFAGIIVSNTFLIQLSGVTLFLSVILYNINMLKIIFHQPKNIA